MNRLGLTVSTTQVPNLEQEHAVPGAFRFARRNVALGGVQNAVICWYRFSFRTSAAALLGWVGRGCRNRWAPPTGHKVRMGFYHCVSRTQLRGAPGCLHRFRAHAYLWINTDHSIDMERFCRRSLQNVKRCSAGLAILPARHLLGILHHQADAGSLWRYAPLCAHTGYRCVRFQPQPRCDQTFPRSACIPLPFCCDNCCISAAWVHRTAACTLCTAYPPMRF